VSRTLIARFSGANIPACSHSTHLWEWPSSPFTFSQNTSCSLDAHQLKGQKFRCYRPHLWNTLPSTLWQMTSYGQFRWHF